MFRKILLAIQQPDERRSLTAAAAELGSAGDSTVLVMHVHRAGGSEPALDGEAMVDLTVDDAKRRGLRAEGEVVTIDQDQDIGRAIGSAATGWHADVVIVGSRRLSDLQAALHGSVSHSVIQHAGCPVMVAPVNGTARAIRSILLAVDGSRASQAAEHLVATLAREHGARVSVIHVPRPLVVAGPVLGGWYVPPPDLEVAPLPAVDDLRRGGVDAEQVTSDSTATVAEAIAEVADRVDADVVVLGSRGLGGVAGLLRGSISHEVMHETDRAVLVTRGEDS